MNILYENELHIYIEKNNKGSIILHLKKLNID